ncbi:nucleoside phosphorylase domain-containing protein [Aspergillus californicus]
MPLKEEDYAVGWICALPKEQTAARAMLDEVHPKLPKPPNDTNTYTLGSIGGHNIVITCLPKGQVGNNSAANVAAQLVQTFPAIKFGLLVGIGGGVPPKVRLGDIVISTPVDQYPGVVQWDFGKAEKDEFRRTGALNNPPSALLSALGELESIHEMEGSKVRYYLEEMGKKWPRLESKYTTCENLEDPLSDSSDRTEDQDNDVHVHYGLIASGNQVIKDAKTRDEINHSLGGNVLCFEMEAAGLINNFPCLILRGICDYADSGKNKDWQEYAAAVAAAYAKEFLNFVQPSDVDNERPVKEVLDQVLTAVSAIRESVSATKSRLEQKEDLEICDWLSKIDYGAQQSDYLRRCEPGTGQWLLDSDEYQTWFEKRGETLFCPGIPGAGKTIITAIIIDNLCTRSRNDSNPRYAYLYCNYRRQEQQTVDHFLLELLGQLLRQARSIPEQVRALCQLHKHCKTRPSLHEIVKALHSVIAMSGMSSHLYIIIDALDECSAAVRTKLLLEVFNL